LRSLISHIVEIASLTFALSFSALNGSLTLASSFNLPAAASALPSTLRKSIPSSLSKSKKVLIFVALSVSSVIRASKKLDIISGSLVLVTAVIKLLIKVLKSPKEP